MPALPTDLAFVDAQYESQSEVEIRAKLGEFLPHMKCCVWDWGDRFREVDNHLAEIKEYYESVSAPAWLLEGIAQRQSQRIESEILYSAAGVQIVTQPYLVGPELEALALQCSMDFVRALPADLPSPMSLEILNGGHYYFVAPAFEAVRGTSCPVTSIRAKRGFDDATQSWKVRCWDKGGADADECESLLVGDTVATGTTLAGTLRQHLDARLANGKSLPNVYVFAIAGSDIVTESVQAMQDVAALLKANGKSLKMYFANAQYKLDKNGTGA